jgi:hypothetical protein
MKSENKHSDRLESEIQSLRQKVELLNLDVNAQVQNLAPSKSALSNHVPKN